MKGLDSIWICDKCHVSFTDEAECAEHEGFCKPDFHICDCNRPIFNKDDRFCSKCKPEKEPGVNLTKCYCGYCGHRFPSTKKRKNHERFCKGRPERKIKSFEDLVIEMRNRQKELEDILPGKTTCRNCKQIFSKYEYYYMHHCPGKPESESDVKDKIWECMNCGRTFSSPQYPHTCKTKAPTLTVELTEEDVIKLEFAISKCKFQNDGIKSIYDDLLAKLRPKKESVEFEVGHYKGRILRERIEITSPAWLIHFPRERFDEFIAAYHDHVNEVK